MLCCIAIVAGAAVYMKRRKQPATADQRQRLQTTTKEVAVTVIDTPRPPDEDGGERNGAHAGDEDGNTPRGTWEQGAWTDDSVGPLDAKLKRRRVRLTGLQRDELNGREGTIVDLLKHRGRYAVLVDGGEVVNVLPSKVELIPGEMEGGDGARAWLVAQEAAEEEGKHHHHHHGKHHGKHHHHGKSPRSDESPRSGGEEERKHRHHHHHHHHHKKGSGDHKKVGPSTPEASHGRSHRHHREEGNGDSGHRHRHHHRRHEGGRSATPTSQYDLADILPTPPSKERKRHHRHHGSRSPHGSRSSFDSLQKFSKV